VRKFKVFYPLREFFFLTAFYKWRLRRYGFREIAFSISDLWPGEAEVGRDIIDGKLVGVLASSPEEIWKIVPDDPLSMESLHGFSWLRHLRAQGGDSARITARIMVGSWLDDYENWHPLYWRGDVLGERISAWVGMHDFFCESADDEFRSRVLTSINRQLEHAIIDFRYVKKGVKRIRALKGIITAIVALDSDASRLETLEDWVLKELVVQVSADGGHISRSPAIQIEFIMALIDIRNCLRVCRWKVPEELIQIIFKMTSMLRLWRHGDGKLALFHGTKEGGASLLESVIALSESGRKTVTEAPNTGFQRLASGRSTLIVDTGGSNGSSGTSHSSPLSFEFSIGKQRLIVNCGTSPGEVLLKNLLRSSPAHSMLTIDNRNAFDADPSSPKPKQNCTVSYQREINDGAILLNTEHDGYLATLGIIHQRKFYLAPLGDDIRGEDRLIYTGEPGEIASKAIIRFHLHPRVRVSLIQNGSSALLRPQIGGGWRFRTDGDLNLEESIYYGSASRQKSEQIVVKKCLKMIRDQGTIVIKWALRREE
jgi:uncharacterized heparinase superfamily protein